MCIPGRYYFKLQANKINFERCSAQQYFKNPYRNLFQSSSLLSIRTFFRICCVIEMSLHCFKRLFLYFTEFYGLFPSLDLAKIRDTVPFNPLGSPSPPIPSYPSLASYFDCKTLAFETHHPAQSCRISPNFSQVSRSIPRDFTG